MKITSRTLILAFLVSLLVSLGSSGAVAAKQRQVALGVSVQDNRNPAAVDAFTASAGGAPAIWGVWSDWGGPDQAFPSSFLSTLKSRDIVPMITWEPVDPTNTSDCTNWSLDATIKGKHDAYIKQWAQAAKAYGGTVLLRYAHEMNGYWFIWGRDRCTNTATKFKQAWKHVWSIFQSVGATNVKFVWSVYGAKRVASFYPGNKYVDYMGFSAFNWGPPKPWKSMVGNFKPAVTALYRTANKPIIATEMGAAYASNCSSCDKASYIAQGYPAVFQKWSRIVGMVYFDWDMRFVNQPDWRLDRPSGALNAYRKIVADSRFQAQIR